MIANIIIKPFSLNQKIPYHLLLLADPSKEIIDTYLNKSEIYVAILNKEVIGIYVLYETQFDKVEIKNIAIAEDYQGKGIGKLMLQHATKTAKEKGYKSIIIGTANSSIAQLYLYQKQGFDITEIKKDFFLKNYPEPLIENGIQVKHMVMLKMEL